MLPNENNKSTFTKGLLIYLFLFFLAYMVADLVLLKFVRPQFLPKLTKKDLAGLNISRETFTGPRTDNDIGSQASLVGPSVRRNLFNSGKMPVPLANMDSEKPSEELEDNIPVKTGLSLTLEGTAVHRNPFRSIATIKGQKETLTYTVGDEIESEARVISVLRKKVIIRNLKNKKLEYVEIDRKLLQAQSPRPKSTTPVLQNSGDAIVRDGNTFKTSRAEVNKYLSNYRSLLSQANTKPAKDPATGEILGFEIFAIKPGSIFEKLGLEDGDVIESVNDESVTNQGKAMSMFNDLRTANEIKISINRGGSTEELEYQID